MGIFNNVQLLLDHLAIHFVQMFSQEMVHSGDHVIQEKGIPAPAIGGATKWVGVMLL